MKEHYDKIFKALDWFTYKRDRPTVFRECIHALALRSSIKTDLYRQKERQEELEKTVKLYEGQEKEKFLELINLIFEMLRNSIDCFGDHLGHIYQNLVPASKQQKTGQFFTPYNVSKMIAKMMFNPNDIKDSQRVIEINEPCVGSGGMIVAVCDALYEENINYTAKVRFICGDIDLMCVEMAYLQLSFLGAQAIVNHQNTLTMEKWDEFRTFAYLINPARN